MKKRPWLRKLFKVILILIVIWVVLDGIVLYIVHFRFDDLLQTVVKKETHGQYALKTGDYAVSLWHRTIRLEDVILSCNDTNTTKNYYSLKIPLLYFSLESVKNLILHNQTTVDSILLVSPDIAIHAGPKSPDTSNPFHPTKILDILKKLTQRMQVRSLHVQNASIAFIDGSDIPFKSTQIEIYIKNFSRKSETNNYLLSSENIELTIRDQFWHLPGGKQTFAFKRLHFSSSNQLAELDNPDYHSMPSSDKGGFEFSAANVYFNSRQLQDIYNKNELNLDSLICVQPVMKIFTAPGRTNTSLSSENVNFYFHHLNFKYIEVKNGSVLVNQPNNSNASYQARQGNFKIYNLTVQPDDSVLMKIDSCHVALQNLKFLSLDSQSVLSIKEFQINNNDLLLYGAEYAPTEYNKSAQLLYFKTPLLHISHINFGELLHKKLSGSLAELSNPVIRVINTSKAAPAPGLTGKKIGNLYTILHTVDNLIDVNGFKLVNANLQYDISPTSTHLQMRDMSCEISLDKLLSSDSLRDIRRSVSHLAVKTLQIQTPKANFVLKGYAFDVLHRSNQTDFLELHLADSSRFSARKLYWEGFVWDLFESRSIFQMSMLRIHEMKMNAYRGPENKIPKANKDLPFISIGRMDIDSMFFSNHNGPKEESHFEADNICLDEIQTSEQFILWGNALAFIHNFKIDNLNAHFSIDRMSFSNEMATQLTNISYESEKETEKFSLTIPSIKSYITPHSTDFSTLAFDSLIVEKPTVVLSKRINTRGGMNNPVALPVFLIARKLMVREGQFQIDMENRGVNSQLIGKMDIQVTNLRASNKEEKIIGYDQFNADLQDLVLKTDKVSLKIPVMNLNLNNGTIQNLSNPRFLTELAIHWKNVSLSEKDNQHDISLVNFNGGIEERRFEFPKKINAISLLQEMAVQDASLRYADKTSIVSAHSISWNPATRNLRVKDFDIHPVLSKDETLKLKNSAHQYTALKGKTFELYGLKITAEPNDSSLQLNKLLIEGLDVSVYKEPELTVPGKESISSSKESTASGKGSTASNKQSAPTGSELTTPGKELTTSGKAELPMPTVQIQNVRLPFHIDTIQLVNGKMESVEVNKKSGKSAVIAMDHINTLVTGIGNKGHYDSLVVRTTAMIFGSQMGFYYTEKYNDPMSAFHLKYNMYPTRLTNMNSLTEAAGAVRIKRGYADTLYADWSGNKKAAVGNVYFYYHDLNIKLLDPSGKANSGFKLSLMTAVANSIVLRKKNNKVAMTFFVRQPEKLIVSYWVGTALNGLTSSVGLTSNSKYLKLYEAKKVEYALPVYHSNQ